MKIFAIIVGFVLNLIILAADNMIKKPSGEGNSKLYIRIEMTLCLIPFSLFIGFLGMVIIATTKSLVILWKGEK
ncbi:MAG: hypothetical protein PHX21_12605 [bacterium]|nr:hypothetical protein [bacterium]